MAKTLIVGENSFIGSVVHSLDRKSTKISYKDIDNINFREYDVVLNCALNPELKTSKYKTGLDFDFHVASKACDSGCHFIMLSTRKVYGSSTELKTYTEQSGLNPYDHYSENKLWSEFHIMSWFKERTTILRGSNLFGYELGRNSMMGYILNQLYKTGNIVYNQNVNTQKDILYVGDAAEMIIAVGDSKPTGIYNFGGGLYSLQTIGHYLGLGTGIPFTVSHENEEYGEQFKLDSSKLFDTLGVCIIPDYISLLLQIGANTCKI